MAWLKLNNTEKASQIFNRLIEFANQHFNDEIKIDYFAVSLPDLLIFEDDFNKRNRVHCHYMTGLGLLGLNEIQQAKEEFEKALQEDAMHFGCKTHIQLATQMIKVNSYETLFDKGEVKIVLNTNDEALYFSRMVIPFIKGVPEKEWHKHHNYYRHVGMYAYRKDVLEKITALPVSALEKVESLEQLRWIENGFTIKCILTGHESHCIDTPEDLERVFQLMNKS